MRRILAPHKEQDGWVYVRVSRAPQPDDIHLSYNDSAPSRRIISSRRVEEAVESADFLKKCAEEGLCAGFDGRYKSWAVLGADDYEMAMQHNQKAERARAGVGRTLREAYYRYHAAVSR